MTSSGSSVQRAIVSNRWGWGSIASDVLNEIGIPGHVIRTARSVAAHGPDTWAPAATAAGLGCEIGRRAWSRGVLLARSRAVQAGLQKHQSARVSGRGHPKVPVEQGCIAETTAQFAFEAGDRVEVLRRARVFVWLRAEAGERSGDGVGQLNHV